MKSEQPLVRIKAIIGSMFSGKSTDFIVSIKAEEKAGEKCQVFKPRRDDRDSLYYIVTHDNVRLPCTSVSSPDLILKLVSSETTVVAIDEVHLFEDWRRLSAVIDSLVARNKRVILAGVDMDYLQKPFEWVLCMHNKAEFTRKLATCVRCGKPARFTQRLGGHGSRIEIGGEEMYEPRCEVCYQAPALVHSGICDRSRDKDNSHAWAQNVTLGFLRLFIRGVAVPYSEALGSFPLLQPALIIMSSCLGFECSPLCQALTKLIFATQIVDPKELGHQYRESLKRVGLSVSVIPRIEKNELISRT